MITVKINRKISFISDFYSAFVFIIVILKFLICLPQVNAFTHLKYRENAEQRQLPLSSFKFCFDHE
jgi:hypothetical protein